MADTWKSIFKGIIENRPVEIEIYDEGGYRVNTTQGADDPGTVQSDGSSTIIIPPTAKGRQIAIEGETTDEIRKDLLAEGFSEAAADKIVGKLSV
ncbi:MAG: hypothetical protein HY849_11500 [Nitrosomonadales bacterium]|nr:hypothetical protein [Nitrosomonadales bacterium]